MITHSVDRVARVRYDSTSVVILASIGSHDQWSYRVNTLEKKGPKHPGRDEYNMNILSDDELKAQQETD